MADRWVTKRSGGLSQYVQLEKRSFEDTLEHVFNDKMLLIPIGAFIVAGGICLLLLVASTILMVLEALFFGSSIFSDHLVRMGGMEALMAGGILLALAIAFLSLPIAILIGFADLHKQREQLRTDLDAANRIPMVIVSFAIATVISFASTNSWETFMSDTPNGIFRSIDAALIFSVVFFVSLFGQIVLLRDFLERLLTETEEAATRAGARNVTE